MRQGTAPQRIGFLSFTRRAAIEARERAGAQLGLKHEDLPWFKTIHSMAFKCIGADRKLVMTTKHVKEVCERVGLDFRGAVTEVEDDSYDPKMPMDMAGDPIVFLENFSRVTGKSLQEVWDIRSESHQDRFLDPSQLHDYARSLYNYKQASGLLDYTDVLTSFLAHGFPPVLDYLIVDEAQDLSRLQWQAVYKISDGVKRVIIAGDDDQAIFRWAGADVETFVGLEGQTRVLDLSYRLARRPMEFSQQIVSRIRTRRQKAFGPRRGPDGAIVEGDVELVDSHEDLQAGRGQWLFLTRHVHQLWALEHHCHEEGWVYEILGRPSNQSKGALALIAWENLRRGSSAPLIDVVSAFRMAGQDVKADALEQGYPAGFHISRAEVDSPLLEKEWYNVLSGGMAPHEPNYFRKAKQTGERIAVLDREANRFVPAPPRIRISTIHGSKGGEADNVYLATSISESTYDAMDRDPDDEARVFYVGATRAKDRLVLQRPSIEDPSYDVPEL